MKLYVAITEQTRSDLSPKELAVNGFGEIYHTDITKLKQPLEPEMLFLLAHGLLFDHDWVRDGTRSEWWIE